MKTLKRILLIVIILVVIAAASFSAWALTPLGPMPEALAALQTDSQVQVTAGGEEDWITFLPTSGSVETGLILYPGGRVDPRSYAPLAHEIAAQGYLVVIMPMPFNLAVFDAGRAQEAIDAHPEIQSWVVGGHSLGGAMAARFAYQNPEAVQGLLLWAAYPASTDDLSGRDLIVASIVGSLDGLGTSQGIEETRRLLPQSTGFTIIEGGNHAQFGWYGEQSGDAPATISREEQQKQILQASLDFLESLR